MPIKIDESLYRKATPEEAKKIQLEVLLAVDSFCKQNNIKYFLYYGTLLGAVRHKGYIPWDDDIDIAMLREDYDKFISAFKWDGIEVSAFGKTKNHPFYITKIFKKDTVIIEDIGRKGYAYGIGIDLFALEKLPDDIKLQKELLSKTKLYMALRRVRAIPFYKKRKLLKAFAVKTLYYMLSFLSPDAVIKKACETVDRYSGFESRQVFDIMLPYGERSIVWAEWFSNTIEADFEGYKLPIPADYDKILTQIYKDYMQLPPEDKQVPRHDIIAYIKQKGGIKMAQKIISGPDSLLQIKRLLEDFNAKKFMLVCSNSFKRSFMMEGLTGMGIDYCIFSGFTPNPDYTEVCDGVDMFRNEDCDAIIAAGGGSAIDVAKSIKLFCKMDKNKFYLDEEPYDTRVPLIAIPTTAGTGSESTRFSVIYYKGEKQSVHHKSIIPDMAVLEAKFLKTLPDYQKKCTLMDALCQAVESWWSVNSDDESKKYAKEAVELIVKYGDEYIFENSDLSNEMIMKASNLAGQAINITATTAPHAMSYKLTTIYGFPHGHSVAVSLLRVWDYMLNHPELCSDKRGQEYLKDTFTDIAKSFGAENTEGAIKIFKNILEKYELNDPVSQDKAQDLKLLADGVNVSRLKNNPVSLSYEAIYGLYDSILKEG